MPYKTFNPPELAPPAPQTWSPIKVHDSGLFHVAGIAAKGDSMYEQACGVFTTIRRLIEAAGGTMNDVMTMTIYVTNLDENTEVWRARREFFTGEFPCSTLIQAQRVGSPKAWPAHRIEINCSGYIGGSR